MTDSPQYVVNGYNGKVYNKLKTPTSLFAWRIKFPDETPLSIIPEENFYITNSENEIFDFVIRIEKSTNSAIITPKDGYDANVYYFLHIKKFKHGIGKNEKKLPPIHVGFKILEDDKLDLIWLKGAFNPETVMERATRVSERKASGFKQEYLGRQEFKYSKIFLILGILITLAQAFLINTLKKFIVIDIAALQAITVSMVGISMFGYILQFIKFCLEYRGGKKQSLELYNAGIANFNIGNYQSAENYLSSAIVADPNNDKAEIAIELNRKYLMKDYLKLQKGEIYMESMSFAYNNTLLIFTGVIGFLYCFITILNELQRISAANAAAAEYLKIFFIITLVMHFIFVFIQSKSYERQSVTSYNNGVELFQNGDMPEAIKNFRLALKYNYKNSRANSAKELTSFILIKEQQRMEQDEFEARIEEAEKKLKEIKEK